MRRKGGQNTPLESRARFHCLLGQLTCIVLFVALHVYAIVSRIASYDSLSSDHMSGLLKGCAGACFHSLSWRTDTDPHCTVHRTMPQVHVRGQSRDMLSHELAIADRSLAVLLHK